MGYSYAVNIAGGSEMGLGGREMGVVGPSHLLNRFLAWVGVVI